MKKHIYISILLLSCALHSQTFPVLSNTSLANPEDDMDNAKNGNYAIDTNNERDQYVGLWEYNQNGVLFQLKIEKQNKVLNKIEYNGEISSYSFMDEVVLRYKLVKNGVTIYNNLSAVTVDSITSYGVKQSSRNHLYGSILDHTRNVIGSYTIEKLFGNPEKINFNLFLGNYRILNPRSYYNDGQPLFSIPIKGIEMVKIN